MQTSYLKYFVDVAREGSVSAAAAANFMSPQGMSRSISVLENELGCPLFVKTPNGMVPSRFGEALLDDANRILGLERQMKDSVVAIRAHEMETNDKSVLLYLNNVAFDEALFSPLTDSIEEVFARARFIQCDNEKAVERLLATDEFRHEVTAIGLLCLFSTDAEHNTALLERLYERGFMFQPYLESYDEVLVAADSELAGKTALSKADIIAHPIITSEGDIQRVCESRFGKASIYMVTADSSFRYEIVKKGQGITFVPAFHRLVAKPDEATAIVPMKDPYYLEIGFAAKREVMESPFVKTLFARLNSYYARFASSPYISLAAGFAEPSSDEELRMPDDAGRSARAAARFGLSQREGQVLALLLEGKTAKIVAAELATSVSTAKSHIYSIYKKAGVHSQEELVAAAAEVRAGD